MSEKLGVPSTNPNLRVPAQGSTPTHSPHATEQLASASNRTRKILKCENDEVGVFYTNASTCEGADLNNQISLAQAFVPKPRETPESNSRPRSRKVAQSTPSTDQCAKIDLRKPRSTPKCVPSSCKWEWGRALEIERMLKASKNPRESTWKPEYRLRLCEMIENGCPLQPKEFCYEQICGSLPAGCRTWLQR